MLRGDETWLVDYQGLRLGLAEYDLASLLLDPYVTLTSNERDDLLHYYADHRGISPFELQECLHLCAAQRLMQALGAYGNLALNLGKPDFLQHIPRAVDNLAHVVKTSRVAVELLPLLKVR